LPISALAPDPKNPRRMADESATGLAISLETFGALDIVFNDETGELVSGDQRVAQLKASGAAEVTRDGDWGHIVHPKTGERFPVRFVRWNATKQSMANLVANNSHLQGEFTEDVIAQARALEDEAHFAELQLDKLVAEEEAKLGEASDSGAGDGAHSSLAERFGVPPFSVLDARQGYWQDRKRAWLALGIQSEIGRGGARAGDERDDSGVEADSGQGSAERERERANRKLQESGQALGVPTQAQAEARGRPVTIPGDSAAMESGGQSHE
jgi:hypothetical protein